MSRLVEFSDSFDCRVMVLVVNKRVLVLHDDFSDLADFLEDFLEVVSSRAAVDSSDVNLGEVWVLLSGSARWASAAIWTSAAWTSFTRRSRS